MVGLSPAIEKYPNSKTTMCFKSAGFYFKIRKNAMARLTPAIAFFGIGKRLLLKRILFYEVPPSCGDFLYFYFHAGGQRLQMGIHDWLHPVKLPLSRTMPRIIAGSKGKQFPGNLLQQHRIVHFIQM